MNFQLPISDPKRSFDLATYRPLRFITITTATEFARCPRKWFMHNGCGFRPVVKHPALQFGEAIGKALPITRVKGLAEGVKVFTECWDGQEDPTGKRTALTAYKALENFYRSHAVGAIYELLPPPEQNPAEGVVSVSEKISDWEIPFALDIGLPVPFIGRADGWGRHRDTGKKWAVEYKTASQLGDTYPQGFRLNPQGVGYSFALSTFGEPLEGTIWEILKIVKPPVRPTTPDNTQTLTHPQHVTPQHMQQFLDWLRYTTHELLAMEKQFMEHGVDFLQKISGCTTFPMFGMPGYVCDYIYSCEAPDWRPFSKFFKVEYHEPFTVTDAKPTAIPSGVTNVV